MRVASLVAVAFLAAGVASFPNAGMAASPLPALPQSPPSGAPADAAAGPPTSEQLASVGCIVAGTATAVLVGAVGVAGASAAGSVAILTPEMLPVLGAAFAAGCGVGMMAAPGAAWLMERVSLVVSGRDEASGMSGRGEPVAGQLDLAAAANR